MLFEIRFYKYDIDICHKEIGSVRVSLLNLQQKSHFNVLSKGKNSGVCEITNVRRTKKY